MTDDLSAAILAVIDQAQQSAPTDKDRSQLDEIRARLDGPIRLAIAGKVKAGKSTLLNALLGEELAPTDAGECTRILTWYRYSDRPFALLHPHDEEPVERPYHRRDGALEVDLGTWTADDIDHLEIGWPTMRLSELVLIDTPGIASIASEVSERTEKALSAQKTRAP